MTKLPFEHKVAIVTGAGNGIGFGIARHLVEQGATVVVNDIDPERAKAATAELNDQSPNHAYSMVGDASDVNFLKELVDFADNLDGASFELVVANAGLTEFGEFFSFTTESFDKVVNLNLKGTFFLCQLAAKTMRNNGSRGSIVLIGSNVGARAYENLAAYGMSKAGISMLAKQLALPLGPLGITINCVSPGAVLTERTAAEIGDYAGTWALLNPNGRVGQPQDIAHTVGFILSPHARHITGQTLLVDGGWTAYGVSPFTVEKIVAAHADSTPQ